MNHSIHEAALQDKTIYRRQYGTIDAYEYAAYFTDTYEREVCIFIEQKIEPIIGNVYTRDGVMHVIINYTCYESERSISVHVPGYYVTDESLLHWLTVVKTILNK